MINNYWQKIIAELVKINKNAIEHQRKKSYNRIKWGKYNYIIDNKKSGGDVL